MGVFRSQRPRSGMGMSNRFRSRLHSNENTGPSAVVGINYGKIKAASKGKVGKDSTNVAKTAGAVRREATKTAGPKFKCATRSNPFAAPCVVAAQGLVVAE